MVTVDTADEVSSALLKIYDEIDGYGLSSQGRARIANYSESFTYGEVTPNVVRQLLRVAQAAPGEVFYDLGSGTGKGVLYAAALGELGRCVGIELIEELAVAARGAAERYQSQIRPMLHTGGADIEFRQGDILETDFADGDVIFAHCTCFAPSLMDAIANRFLDARTGTRLITVSKEVSADHLELLSSETCQMGWGSATLYVYRRR